MPRTSAWQPKRRGQADRAGRALRGKSRRRRSAKGVYGVKGTANDMMVELVGYGKRTDQDVATAALNALKWDYEVPEEKVKIVVKNGWVTLDGTVDWQNQKDAAERCVRYLIGVIAVSTT